MTDQQFLRLADALDPPPDDFILKKVLVRCVATKTGCWEWMGANWRGRAQVRYQRKTHWVYRLTYAWFHGAIPEDFDVHHECHNKRCVNPKHLKLLERSRNAAEGNVERRDNGATDDIPF
jgi:hypothetical protein